MNRYLLILACIALTGCASTRPQEGKDTLAEHPQYETATASALAFDAPIAAGYTLLGLDRDAREPGAFIGYQDTVVETFSISLDDTQSNDPFLDIYARSSSSQKVGTRYR